MPETDVIEPECLNCHTPLKGQFCSRCGQNQKGFDRFFLSLIRESFDDIFATDSRASKTIFALLFRPGFLTKEYFAGRRARYVQPLRLYFITSLAFFLLLSLQNLANSDNMQLHMDDFDDEDLAAYESARKESQDGLNVDLAFLSKDQEERLEEFFSMQVEKAKEMAENDPGRIVDMILDFAPPVVFCLLPLFAFLLKIVYINTDRFYTQHLVLAVHNHCFLYIAFLVDDFFDLFSNYLVSQACQAAIATWIPVYLIMSLKTNYREGWILTLFKGGLLAFSYFVLFFFAALIAMLVGLITL